MYMDISITLSGCLLRMAVDKGARDPIQADDKLPLNVVNNYFSVGFDALVALQFHKARSRYIR